VRPHLRKLRFLSVVVIPPALHQHLRLKERVEDLHVQQLVRQLAVEYVDPFFM